MNAHSFPFLPSFFLFSCLTSCSLFLWLDGKIVIAVLKGMDAGHILMSCDMCPIGLDYFIAGPFPTPSSSVVETARSHVLNVLLFMYQVQAEKNFEAGLF